VVLVDIHLHRLVEIGRLYQLRAREVPVLDGAALGAGQGRQGQQQSDGEKSGKRKTTFGRDHVWPPSGDIWVPPKDRAISLKTNRNLAFFEKSAGKIAAKAKPFAPTLHRGCSGGENTARGARRRREPASTRARGSGPIGARPGRAPGPR